MYDTVNFRIDRIDAGNDFQASTKYLTNARETVDIDTGDIWTIGNIENLKVVVSMSGVSVKGSLAKFFFPDNTYTLTRHHVKEAIAKLSDTLHLDLLKADVSRIDVSTNFIMKHKTSEYYDVLGLCRYFNRVQVENETLYYNNKGKERKRTMIFYDKAREVAKRGGVLPAVFQIEGTNLLRYESSWRTRLPQQLKEPEVKGSTLYDRLFYSKIINLWANNYFNIEKKRTLKDEVMNIETMSKITTVSDALDYIHAIALQRMPPDELQDILNTLKRRNIFNDKKYYTRLKQKIKSISDNSNFTDKNELVKEMDSQVRTILAYKR